MNNKKQSSGVCVSSSQEEDCFKTFIQHSETNSTRNKGTVCDVIIDKLAQFSSNPDRFLSLYESVTSKKCEYLSSTNLLKQLNDRRNESSKPINKSKVNQCNPTMSLQGVSLSGSSRSQADELTRDEIPQLYNRLEQVAAQVQRKAAGKSVHVNTHFSNWTVLRPYMSRDFIDDPPGSPVPPPICAIPFQSQESILIEDLLSCLVGFQGKYITSQPLQSNSATLTFNVSDSVEPSLRNLVLQILPLASNYSSITRFIQEKRQLDGGRVNQAVAASMTHMRDDFVVFIAQLETQHRRQQMNLHKMWYYLQSNLTAMQTLTSIVTAINTNQARGAQTLTLLHEATLRCVANANAQKLCLNFTRSAAVPYFQSLHQWLHKGIVFDPCGEFMIEDNVSMEKDMNKVTGLYSDEYWSHRYKIKKENVPVFLEDVQEYILRTGKYLNVVRQCSENSNISEVPMDQLVYTMRGEQYLTIIDNAYQYASTKLLNLLLTNYDIINRIKSLKRYFLMEQGDFIVQLLDLCEEELDKNIEDVAPNRLQTLLEVALRTSCGKFDPYKEDLHLTILRQNNTYQIYKIQSIGKDTVAEYMQGECPKSKTGLEGFAFQVTSKWPLSLLFNEKVIGCYQMLFRHLLYCKHVDRRLCRVWICDKAVKILPCRSASGYLNAFSLRQRMLFCVQNLEYYMVEEAIEPNWIRFTQRLTDNTLPAPKAKRKTPKQKKDEGPPWRETEFKPDPVLLLQPAYKPWESDEGWDDDQFIAQYIDDAILSLMVEKSNQTFVHLVGKSLKLTIDELKVWFGMTCIMSALQYPKIRMFWEKDYRVPIISEAMSRDRYFLIRKSIKVVFDNDITDAQRQQDRIWKIRPLVDRVLRGCMDQPRSQEICVDEMMVPFSGACGVKQYVPNKPNPVGLKIFVLANPNGIVCDFTIYQGRTTFPELSAQGFTLGESAVLNMAQSLVPGHIIYMDRYFTTVKLFDTLLDMGIRCSGTVMKNQVPKNIDFINEKQFQKQDRGTSVVSIREDGAIACTKWLDNKPVTMLSTHESKEPEGEVKRWSKKEKKYIEVKQPKVINSYNKNMGGVDLADRMLSYCPSRARTKKWTVRCIMHFVDMAIVNAWLEMREVKKSKGIPPKAIPQFRTFKLKFGERLVHKNTNPDDSEDTDSDEEDLIVFEDGRKKALPSVERRARGAKHLPQVHDGQQQRCRRPKCNLKSTIFCSSCKVFLCLKKNNNCFYQFHQK